MQPKGYRFLNFHKCFGLAASYSYDLLSHTSKWRALQCPPVSDYVKKKSLESHFTFISGHHSFCVKVALYLGYRINSTSSHQPSKASGGKDKHNGTEAE